MQSLDTPLAAVIANARKARGLSTHALAAETGLAQSTIVRVESGFISAPQPAVLAGLARALNLDLADLYALAGHTQSADLPAFTPYLRSKFTDLPAEAQAELSKSFDRIAKKYGYSSGGPTAGEDEK